MAIQPKKSPITKIAGAIVKGVEKKVAGKVAAKATTKGLKAARGASLAPKGYKPDTAGRALATEKAKQFERGTYNKTASMFNEPTPRKKAYTAGAKEAQSLRNQATMVKDKAAAAPKNVISKSGRTANTSRLTRRAK